MQTDKSVYSVACIGHPTGALHFWRDEAETEFYAEFKDITRRELVEWTAWRLNRENRFSDSLATSFTVLEHSLALRDFMLQNGMEHLALPAAVHDTAEIFGDWCTPLKTRQDCARERAILDAFGWPVSEKGMGSKDLKRWDHIAAIAEGQLFGFPEWAWTKEQDCEDAKAYRQFLLHRQNRLSYVGPVEDWTKYIEQEFSKRGLSY